jgi:hypothetical protein
MRFVRLAAQAAVGAALVAVGWLHLTLLQDDVAIVTGEGQPVAARVVSVEKAFLLSRGLWTVRVAYPAAGRERTADLIDVGSAPLPTAGDDLTVYVDPADPRRVATADGLIAESRWAYWHFAAWGFGGTLLVLAVIGIVRGRRGAGDDDRGDLVSRTVVHVSPVRADIADGTARVALVDARVRTEEELPVRTVGPGRVEVCAVPFAAVRYALGDVVEVGDHGRLRDVVEPSGQVTFAVRMSPGGGAGGDVRDEAVRRGALVESSTAELFAVSLEGTEQIASFLSFLERAEAAGRLTFRSPARPGDLSDALP